MGKLLIILFSSPLEDQNIDTIYKFAKAAIEEHEVSIFCDLDAVYNLMASQTLPNQRTSPGKLAELIEKGVQVLICQESARRRGLDVEKGLLKGTMKSSLSELSQLVEESDRVVSFNV